jgi:hypothetical protein
MFPFSSVEASGVELSTQVFVDSEIMIRINILTTILKDGIGY